MYIVIDWQKLHIHYHYTYWKQKTKQNKMKTRIEFTTYVQCWALEIKSLFALNVLYMYW